MNTRGLMELVILNVGRDLGVITPAVFAMMVLMALVTTFMTTPLLQIVMPKRLYQAALAAGTRVKARGFSVLIPVAHPRSGGPLLQLSATLVDPGAERAIFALHLRRPADREAYHPLLADERKPESEEVLRPLLAQAEKHGIPVEAILLTATDVAAGVAEVAAERQASLVLIGFHHSVFSRTMLGGTVHRILETVETDVAVFVDRGYFGGRKILVPYRGGEHDRLALQIAARAARGAEAQVEVLHVISSGARGGSKPAAARTEAERLFAPRGAERPHNWSFRSIDDASPVDAVLRESASYDLVVIGVSEEWGLESHLFGLRPERIAEQSPTSMLIVRKFGEVRELPTELDAMASAPPPPGEVGGAAVSSSVSSK
jgi:nucleotide-binding universal stress UspA family protein